MNQSGVSTNVASIGVELTISALSRPTVLAMAVPRIDGHGALSAAFCLKISRLISISFPASSSEGQLA